MGFIRHAMIAIISPRQFHSPQRTSKILGQFAETESDSAWHFLRAAEMAEKVEQRAVLFETAIEEMHHADLFRRLARREAVTQSQPLARTVLLESPAELPEFIAFAYVSEKKVSREFAAMSESCDDAEIVAAFKEIYLDEVGHDQSTEKLLSQFQPSRRKRKWIVRRAVARSLLADLKRLGRNISTLVWNVCLGFVYIFMGPLTVRASRRRMRNRVSVAADGGETRPRLEHTMHTPTGKNL